MNLEEYAVAKIKRLEFENQKLEETLKIAGNLDKFKESLIAEITKVPPSRYSYSGPTVYESEGQWVKNAIISIVRNFK